MAEGGFTGPRTGWLEVARRITLRYVLPIAAAVSLLALLGVPFLQRLLTDWFRTDVEMRSSLVMNSIGPPLGGLLLDDDFTGARAYLAQVANDERLLGIAVCGAQGSACCRRTSCRRQSHARPRASRAGADVVLRAPAGRVQVSRFPLQAGEQCGRCCWCTTSASSTAARPSARNFVLAAAVIGATLLALAVGLSRTPARQPLDPPAAR